MKTLFITSLFTLAAASVSFAQTAEPKAPLAQATEVAQAEAEPEKKKIEMEAVPVEVQEAFKKSYETESVKEIYEVSENNNKFYDFIVLEDAKKWSVRYDATGQELKKEEVIDEQD